MSSTKKNQRDEPVEQSAEPSSRSLKKSKSSEPEPASDDDYVPSSDVDEQKAARKKDEIEYYDTESLIEDFEKLCKIFEVSECGGNARVRIGMEFVVAYNLQSSLSSKRSAITKQQVLDLRRDLALKIYELAGGKKKLPESPQPESPSPTPHDDFILVTTTAILNLYRSIFMNGVRQGCNVSREAKVQLELDLAQARLSNLNRSDKVAKYYRLFKPVNPYLSTEMTVDELDEKLTELYRKSAVVLSTGVKVHKMAKVDFFELQRDAAIMNSKKNPLFVSTN